MRVWAAVVFALPVTLAGCGWSPSLPGTGTSSKSAASVVATPGAGNPQVAAGPPPAVPPAAATPAVQEPAPAGVLTQAPELPRPPAPAYETKGRRDPFEVLETREGAPGTSVSAARLAGVVRSRSGPMALIETPDGLGYILRPGDVLGEGRLLEVQADSVIFTVPMRNGGTSRVVLKLPGE
jgi:Tfp pilus assembly protein PilP